MSDFKTYKDCYTPVDKNEAQKGGGQGLTFKVRRTALRQDLPIFIIKVLKQQKDIERRTRMVREFTSLQTLKASGIPSAIESNTEFYDNLDYKLFIVMEYINGITVSELVQALLNKTLKISFSEVAAFFNRLLDITSSCHKINIIHRDLKPDNIVLKDNDLSKSVFWNLNILH
jgi:serine/threonine-protein kinase